MEKKEKSYITPEEYLEIEREAEFKSEYYKGETFALAGAGFHHNIISLNIASLLLNKLKDEDCFVFSNDMRLYIKEHSLYTYPDIMIVCGEIKFLDEQKDNVLNPILIIEVLSKSTESYDRGKKFEFYRSLSSLKEYVMVSSDHYLVEAYSKNENNLWELNDKNNPESSIKLSSISLQIPLKEIYSKVEFES